MTLHYTLMGIGLFLCIVGLVVSVWIMSKQQHQELDRSMNGTTKRHSILGNRILIAYILFPVAIVLGAVILMYYRS